MQPERIWTIGHSTRQLEEFLLLLEAHRIGIVADVRRFPGSRKHPQFSAEPLAAALQERGIRYEHIVQLGGRRRARPDSRNTAWRNDAFRGYADYMESDDYRSGLDRLLTVASESRTAVLCSEAVWWRCHRGLIADDLKVRGIQVLHIAGAADVQEHPFTPAARVLEGVLTYSIES